ncbi:hypothetical protein [Actinomadura verrucosospora]
MQPDHACRDVLLGAEPSVTMTERAVRYLATNREGGHLYHPSRRHRDHP